MLKRMIVVLALLLYDVSALSDNSVPGVTLAQQSTSPSSPKNESPIFKPGHLHFNIYAGRYDVSEEPQFVGVRSKYGLGLGVSMDFANQPYLAMDLELFFVNREYTTPIGPPLWGTIDNDTSVQTTAFLLGARLFYPDAARLRTYASAGLGLFRTRMVVTGSVLGFPGVYEDYDSSINPYFGLGVSYLFDRYGLSLDMRHFKLNGNFSAFNVSNAKLGGNLLLLGWQSTF